MIISKFDPNRDVLFGDFLFSSIVVFKIPERKME